MSSFLATRVITRRFRILALSLAERFTTFRQIRREANAARERAERGTPDAFIEYDATCAHPPVWSVDVLRL
jgi:hypothetical protein